MTPVKTEARPRSSRLGTPLRRACRIGLAAAGLAAVALGAAHAPVAQAATPPDKVSYVVMPHPDDEFEQWSLVENSPDNYKVFIVLTHGEQTAYCIDENTSTAGFQNGGYQPGLENAPNPTPTGRWTSNCEEARLNANRAFFTAMSSTDTSIPGSWTYQGVKGAFAANGVSICRKDQADDSACTTTDRTARVWTDSQNRGALVVFNLGDGDLTADETAWAIKTVRDNRAALGINSSLPNWNVVGSYANSLNDGGFLYDHRDHKAVHSALWNVDFNMKYQAAATSKNDSDVSRIATVTAASTDAAFRTTSSGAANGAHNKNYGWLWYQNPDPITGGSVNYYQVDTSAQRELFHTQQYFWQRFVR